MQGQQIKVAVCGEGLGRKVSLYGGCDDNYHFLSRRGGIVMQKRDIFLDYPGKQLSSQWLPEHRPCLYAHIFIVSTFFFLFRYTGL